MPAIVSTRVLMWTLLTPVDSMLVEPISVCLALALNMCLAFNISGIFQQSGRTVIVERMALSGSCQTIQRLGRMIRGSPGEQLSSLTKSCALSKALLRVKPSLLRVLPRLRYLRCVSNSASEEPRHIRPSCESPCNCA